MQQREGIGIMAGIGLVVVTRGMALATDVSDSGIITKDTVSPGSIGFVIFVALGLGTFFLYLSMTRQLKRIDFDESDSSQAPVVDVTESTQSNRGQGVRRDGAAETDSGS